jgi:hypothetical protein
MVNVWINAFIPGTVPGYTRTVAAGTHAGKTAVPLPGLARLNPLNTFKAWNAGYLTDQRTFSSAPAASCRMQSSAVISLAPAALARQAHISSGTTEVDIVTGAVSGFAVANMTRCRFLRFTATPTVITVDVKGEASDPLVSAAADIDYEGTFTVTILGPRRLTVGFTGLIDAFPAFECYASVGGVTKTLFTAPPPPGNTVTNLPGAANRRIAGLVRFP